MRNGHENGETVAKSATKALNGHVKRQSVAKNWVRDGCGHQTAPSVANTTLSATVRHGNSNSVAESANWRNSATEWVAILRFMCNFAADMGYLATKRVAG